MKTREITSDSSPLISVVIAAYNASDYLFKCLEAIYQSSYSNIQVIVVDDCSTDESRQIASKFPCHLISLAEHGGPGKARNVGVAASSGSIIFFTDADVLVAPKVIEQIVAFLNSNQEISGIVGCYTKETPETGFVSTYKNLLHHYVHHQSAGLVTGFFTACGAIRREAFEQAGGFDESASNCFLEDIELGMRLQRRGCKIVLLPNIQVTHRKRYTLRSLIRSDFWQRAVPYTIHMLRNRVFPNQLSTKISDRASVFLIYLSLLLLAAPVTGAPLVFVAGAVAALSTVIFLNRRFYAFVLEHKGKRFLLKSVILQFMIYMLSGLGLIVGGGIYLLRGMERAEIEHPLTDKKPQVAGAEILPRVNPYILSVTPHHPPKPEAGLLRMAFNENPVGPSPLALEAIRDAMFDINHYPDSRGMKLKEALARKHNLRPENIILGQGASEILEIITRAFLCPGDEIIIPDPTFPYYRILGQLCGCNSITVPLRNGTVDLDALAAAVTPRTKIIFIANPNNPTGTVVEQPEIERFLRLVPDKVMIVFDEAYIDYASGKEIDTVCLLSQRPLISVRTFSKTLGLAGNRIGYGMATAKIIELISKIRRPYNTCTLAQAAALASLADHKHLEKTIQTVTQGRAFLYQQFERLGLDYVLSHTNFILVDLHINTSDITDVLLSLGILVRPMPPTGMRVSVGTSEQNARFIRALDYALQKAGRLPETSFVLTAPVITVSGDASTNERRIYP